MLSNNDLTVSAFNDVFKGYPNTRTCIVNYSSISKMLLGILG